MKARPSHILSAVVMLALAGSGDALARSRSSDNGQSDSNSDGNGRRNDDQDMARRALQNGEVMSILRILELAAQQLPGDVVEVKLDRRRGRLAYEIKVLTPAGQVRELVLDARTGVFVTIED
jgi:uncharacterized membrane protein YkoI